MRTSMCVCGENCVVKQGWMQNVGKWGGVGDYESSKYSLKSPNEDERIIVNGRGEGGGRGSGNPIEPPMDPLLVKYRLQ